MAKRWQDIRRKHSPEVEARIRQRVESARVALAQPAEDAIAAEKHEQEDEPGQERCKSAE